MKAVSNYDISFYYDESLEKIALNKELQLNLYRVAQEALRNIVKYAQATRIRLEAILYKENLNLLIADNGIGYDPEIPSKGIGIANMHRRVDFFQGHLMINSSPGDGCEILVKIPLKKLTRETVNPHTEKNSLHKSF